MSENFISRVLDGNIVIQAYLVKEGITTEINLDQEGIKTVDDLNNSPLIKSFLQPTAEEIEAITNEKVGEYVDRLMAFCNQFVKDMMIENIRLGIGKADTKVVQAITDLTAPALNAVSLGSLRVAIEQIAAIDESQLDGHFLTSQRLTSKRNEIETFLGIPKSKAYND